MLFEQHITAIIDNASGASAQHLCRDLGPLVTDPGVASAWLQERLADLARDLPILPAGYADPVCQSLTILDHKRVHLSLALISAKAWQAQHTARRDAPDILGFADGWTMIRFLGTPHATLQLFVLEGADGARRAYPEAPEAASPDRLVTLDNTKHALRFVDVGSDVIMMRLLVRDPEAEHAIECDARDGAVVRVREAQSRYGRIRMILSLLRSLERRDAVSTIAEHLASWPAHLRWHGVREALVTDSLAGFALLETLATHDPDPQLRDLARRTRAELITRYPGLAA